MTGAIVRTIIQVVLGLVLIYNVPEWLGLKSVFAWIVKLIGVLVILSALLNWI